MVASPRVLPSARLNEIVVANSVSWWLIAVGVAASTKCATASSGTSGVTEFASALPVDESRAPGLAATVGTVAVVAALAAVLAPVVLPPPVGVLVFVVTAAASAACVVTAVPEVGAPLATPLAGT